MQGEGEIDSRLKQIEAVTLEGYSGASFGDKSNFTVGVSFLTCKYPFYSVEKTNLV